METLSFEPSFRSCSCRNHGPLFERHLGFSVLSGLCLDASGDAVAFQQSTPSARRRAKFYSVAAGNEIQSMRVCKARKHCGKTSLPKPFQVIVENEAKRLKRSGIKQVAKNMVDIDSEDVGCEGEKIR